MTVQDEKWVVNDAMFFPSTVGTPVDVHIPICTVDIQEQPQMERKGKCARRLLGFCMIMFITLFAISVLGPEQPQRIPVQYEVVEETLILTNEDGEHLTVVSNSIEIKIPDGSRIFIQQQEVFDNSRGGGKIMDVGTFILEQPVNYNTEEADALPCMMSEKPMPTDFEQPMHYEIGQANPSSVREADTAPTGLDGVQIILEPEPMEIDEYEGEEVESVEEAEDTYDFVEEEDKEGPYFKIFPITIYKSSR